MTLAEARAKALANRRIAVKGRDPRTSDTPTFAAAAEKVIDLHRPTWKPGSRTELQWRQMLDRYTGPLAAMPVDRIGRGNVLAVLAPIWGDKPESARKLSHRISAVMDWAMGAGHRSDNPTAAAMAALPKPNGRVEHYRALPHADLPAALGRVRASDAATATKLALELLVLTAARSGEVRHADWSEVDGDVWTIPAERTKTSTAQRVPLSARAVAVLESARSLTGGRGLIFPSPTTGRALSDNTLVKLLRETGTDATCHGMRASFRSWAADTGQNREASELALGHVVKGVEGAYQRSDLLDARSDLMEAWSAAIA